MPARIVAVRGPDHAVVDLGGVRKDVSIELVPHARVGDYVIIHVGYAIGMLDVDEAEATLRLFAELAAQTPAGA